MRGRIRRALAKLDTFYGGWRGIVAGVGLLIVAVAAVFLDARTWVVFGCVWILTLLLIGVQKPPKMTVVTVEVEKKKPLPPRRQWGRLVTVVVTTFNEGEYLTHCLSSVMHQTHHNLQCIVVDDASTDGSLEPAIEAIEADSRFTVITNPTNRGLAGSRNVGLEAATGSMITFLDGDDFLYPEAIGARLMAFESAVDNGTLGGAFCNWQMVPEGEVPGDPPPVRTLRKDVTWLSAVEDNPFIASAPMILTDAARAVGGFDEDRPTAEDFDFWSRFLRHGYALRATQYVGIAYRQKKASMYRTTIEDHVDVQLDVYGFNFRPMAPGETMAGTPFVFKKAPAEYQQQLMKSRRLLVGYIVAMHDGNQAAQTRFLEAFHHSVEPWMLWAQNWSALIQKTAGRLEAYSSEAFDMRVRDLSEQVEARVRPLLLRNTLE